jgi:predicted esterase
VRYLDRLLATLLGRIRGEPRVGVLGFSQGVHTAARWVSLGEVRPRRTVLWGAYLPGDLPPGDVRERLGRTRLTLVQGRTDPHRRDDLEREHTRLLDELGLAWELVEHDAGHELDEATLGRVLDLTR